MVLMSTDNAELPALPNGFKYMPCRYCKAPMVVGNKRRNAPGHLECGLQVAMTNMKQIQEKKGPYYERWRMGQLRHLERLAGGAPPESD